MSLILYGKVLMISKVVLYLVLIMWFWRLPVAAISKELVQPFGNSLYNHCHNKLYHLYANKGSPQNNLESDGFATGISDGFQKFINAEGTTGLYKGLGPLWGDRFRVFAKGMECDVSLL